MYIYNIDTLVFAPKYYYTNILKQNAIVIMIMLLNFNRYTKTQAISKILLYSYIPVHYTRNYTLILSGYVYSRSLIASVRPGAREPPPVKLKSNRNCIINLR